ncbi:MAG TPA: hypothetical protein VHA11_03535, partial [Bryobacteraceae bacterium]|nr:hypothetical protein [Bryobacteraceae bacterium]
MIRTITAAAWTALGAASALFAGTFPQEVRRFYTAADGLPSPDVRRIVIHADAVYAETAAGAARFAAGRWAPAAIPAEAPPQLAGLEKIVRGSPEVRQTAVAPDGRVAVAALGGLYLRDPAGHWSSLHPRSGTYSWAPYDVRGVTFDAHGRLWFASPQGVGRLAETWTLYTGAEGLPYDDFTTAAAGEDGVVWFGTHRGAIRFDGTTWEYRQGLRWLPGDDVRSIAVDRNGNAWCATGNGIGMISRRPMTFAEKAKFFEDEIDKRHRRTPYGFVESVGLQRPGDLSEWTQHDSDNDGLWTSMYGAGECFAYGATHDPLAKKRARAAFEALRFLGTVTQGGPHPAPKGFVARTVLPANGPDPNRQDSAEHDQRMRETRDRLWKTIVPRWPLNADGQWYWKSDTSSDELDGHYFFYAVYYDLVAETQEERQAVRDHVAALTEHLVAHDFSLVDHDGKPTRWGVFSPAKLNHGVDFWEERGLNSLSILAYLRTAAHITGDPKFTAAANMLIEKHAYAANVLIAKTNAGPGSGNQSDDEMAFMTFFCLLRYETDPKLRELFAFAFYRRWIMERPELNPLFNFLYAASAKGIVFHDAWEPQDLTPTGDWLAQSVDTLQRYPLDRVNWGLANSHRKDLTPLPLYAGGSPQRGSRRDGRVLPIDERFVDKWNHDPWQLDHGGSGSELADGA